jgi:putative hydrolase of the HAD superfamily
MSKYKHLFFDLDHTLWDFETNAKAALNDLYIANALQEKGIGNFDDFFDKYSYYNHKLWDKYAKGLIKQEELRWKRMWLALLDYKIADEALSKKLSLAFLDHLPTKQNLFAYTVEILTYLTNKSYQLHLITNGFESVQHSKLKSCGLTNYFVEIITSEGSNSLKPNKEIFDYALQKANAQINESIMIGDNLDADIDGALNAGMDAIYVNHLTNEEYKKANYTVFHLKELEAIF